MTVCIITYDEYINVPYVIKYENIMSKYGIVYDIMLWDRSGQGKERSLGARHNYVFNKRVKAPKASKLLPFLAWKMFAEHIILTNKYDLLIACTTLPGVLISNILTRRYRGRYILDIRDFTYENWGVYKAIAEKNIAAAGLVLISSSGFLEWLPAGVRASVVHNISNIESECKATNALSSDKEITIGFVGGVRYFEVNRMIINSLKNNSRYRLIYVGKQHSGCDLVSFCQQNFISNVSFLPRYVNAEKPNIYKSIDLINSIYGADSPETKTLLSHKLYDCVLYKKPIIVSKNTFLSEVVERYHLGFSIDISKESLVERLDKYLATFSLDIFLNGCGYFLQKVMSQQAETDKEIEEFIAHNAD